MPTFTIARVWQVVHVAQELHEVPSKGRHDIGRVAACQPAHHLYSQSTHNPSLIIQSHKQRPQAAATTAGEGIYKHRPAYKTDQLCQI